MASTVLNDWKLYISLVAAVLGAFHLWERYRKAKRDWFDWTLDIAAKAAKANGGNTGTAVEHARALLGNDWKSIVWAQFRSTWTERPNPDGKQELELLQHCVAARMLPAASVREQSAV